MNGLLTTREVATRLKVCQETVVRLLRARKLDGFKAGHNWRISEQALEAFINGQAGAELRSGVVPSPALAPALIR